MRARFRRPCFLVKLSFLALWAILRPAPLQAVPAGALNPTLLVSPGSVPLGEEVTVTVRYTCPAAGCAPLARPGLLTVATLTTTGGTWVAVSQSNNLVSFDGVLSRTPVASAPGRGLGTGVLEVPASGEPTTPGTHALTAILSTAGLTQPQTLTITYSEESTAGAPLVISGPVPVTAPPPVFTAGPPSQPVTQPAVLAASPTGTTLTCPPAGQWFLLYWRAAGPAALSVVAGLCPNADRLWVRRDGMWFGYSADTPAASDQVLVQVNEAVFVHGRGL